MLLTLHQALHVYLCGIGRYAGLDLHMSDSGKRTC